MATLRSHRFSATLASFALVIKEAVCVESVDPPGWDV